MTGYDLHQRAAALVRDSGGKLVGRTRLQKLAYLSQLAGFSDDFPFEYKHYGPYSEQLAQAMEIATGLKLVSEEERKTDWGGWYSIYSVADEAAENLDRARFLTEASKLGAIELELAATAAFLFSEIGLGQDIPGDPWEETAQLKPDKSDDGRLDRAKAAYGELLKLETPKGLPAIV